ncbi:MAG: hypothetical protein ACR2N2_01595, partial [Acidimicrobiia bacterium]
MITRLRRAVVVGAAAAVVMTVAAPVMADELSDVLADAHESTYTATRLTVSVWGEQTKLVRERVEHANGSEMVLVDETWSMTGNGQRLVMDDAPRGLAFLSDAGPLSTDKYTLGETTTVTHMKRRCTLVSILEDDRVRAHMVIDERTGAPLITYVYDGNGSTFRTVSLSEFAPHRTYEWPEDRTNAPLEVVMHHDSDLLPAEAAGYQLVDAFPGPANSDQGFYTDGLFSYSLFALPAGTVVDGFDESSTFVTESGVYDIV